jgi:hypothetical protein
MFAQGRSGDFAPADFLFTSLIPAHSRPKDGVLSHAYA